MFYQSILKESNVEFLIFQFFFPYYITQKSCLHGDAVNHGTKKYYSLIYSAWQPDMKAKVL